MSIYTAVQRSQRPSYLFTYDSFSHLCKVTGYLMAWEDGWVIRANLKSINHWFLPLQPQLLYIVIILHYTIFARTGQKMDLNFCVVAHSTTVYVWDTLGSWLIKNLLNYIVCYSCLYSETPILITSDLVWLLKLSQSPFFLSPEINNFPSAQSPEILHQDLERT